MNPAIAGYGDQDRSERSSKPGRSRLALVTPLERYPVRARPRRKRVAYCIRETPLCKRFFTQKSLDVRDSQREAVVRLQTLND